MNILNFLFIVSQTRDNLPWYLAKITFFCEEYNKYFSGSLAHTCRHVALMGGMSDHRPSATTPKSPLSFVSPLLEHAAAAWAGAKKAAAGPSHPDMRAGVATGFWQAGRCLMVIAFGSGGAMARVEAARVAAHEGLGLLLRRHRRSLTHAMWQHHCWS